MADQAKNILIGIFVLTAFAIIIFILLFLHPSTGDEGRQIRVRFANIDKINVGTRVTFGGKPVGEVTSIKELPSVLNHRESIDGKVYVYELILSVDSGVHIFETDQISSRTSGLLGEKSVEITPLTPPEGEPLVPLGKKIVYAYEGGSVEDTFKEIKDVADRFDTALDSINDALNEIKNEHIIANISKIMENVRDITGALNDPQRLTDIMDNIHTVSKDVNTFTAKIAAGEGTVGRLVMRDELYLHFNAALNKLETLLDDINHYGILYHLDKGWQRMRARRANILSKLQTPQEFRNYFNDEMDTITTSISRVTTVLENSDYQVCTPLYNNREFTKVYAELLRRVAEMEESLKIYNDQVVDTDVRRTELVPQYDRCCH